MKMFRSFEGSCALHNQQHLSCQKSCITRPCRCGKWVSTWMCLATNRASLELKIRIRCRKGCEKHCPKKVNNIGKKNHHSSPKTWNILKNDCRGQNAAWKTMRSTKITFAVHKAPNPRCPKKVKNFGKKCKVNWPPFFTKAMKHPGKWVSETKCSAKNDSVDENNLFREKRN